MTQREEQILKQQFVDRNPYACRGLKAATGHVKFYVDGISSQQRIDIQESWLRHMDLLAEKYVQEQTRETFLTDVRSLSRSMTSEYPNAFAEGCFSFARAQKSFSVVLKYRWCSGRIAMPPLCPVDRGVLGRMGAPYNTWRWIEMTETQYLQVYNQLQVLSGNLNLSVAQMELLWFSR